MFSDDNGWAEPEMLNKYLTGERRWRNYQKAMRGYYQLPDQEEEGRIGPHAGGRRRGYAAMPAQLFKGRSAGPFAARVEPKISP